MQNYTPLSSRLIMLGIAGCCLSVCAALWIVFAMGLMI